MTVEGSDKIECALSGGSATNKDVDQEWMLDFKTEKSRKSGHGRGGSVETQSDKLRIESDGVLTSSERVGVINSSKTRRNTVMCLGVTISVSVNGTESGECEKAFWKEQMNARSSRVER